MKTELRIKQVLMGLVILAAVLFESCNNSTNPATPIPPPVPFTATPAGTLAFTSTLTNTPVSSYTFTNTPTNTNTATLTNTPLNTFTFTNTPTNTYTATNTNTFTNTATSTATSTFSNTPVSSFTFTNTATNTDTLTVTNTATNTFTATITNTPASTSTFTNTPTMTATATITNTPPVCQLVGDTNVYSYGGIGELFWRRVQAPAGTTKLSGYSFYTYVPSPPVPWNIEMALYTDNSGSVGNLIAGSDTGEISLSLATPSGVQNPVLGTSVATTAGTFYWVAYMNSGGLAINTGATTADFTLQGGVAYNSLPANGSSGNPGGYTFPINFAGNFCQ
jgi:hypothetical protein